MPKAIQTDHAPAAIGPYSQAIICEAGSLLYTAGQIPLDPGTGEMVQDTIEEATHRVFENLEAVLAEAGCTFDDVIKTTVFMKDMGEFAAMNAVYATYFTGTPPARSAVQAAMLPKDARVEIELVARVRG